MHDDAKRTSFGVAFVRLQSTRTGLDAIVILLEIGSVEVYLLIVQKKKKNHPVVNISDILPLFQQLKPHEPKSI